MVKRPSSSSSAAAAAAACGGEGAKYTGVRKRKWGKWVSEIRLPNSRERIWLGSYDNPEKAARAFDAALFCLRGNTANFNFPHHPPCIPGGRSLPPSQIQAAAARYANSPPSTPPHHLQLADPAADHETNWTPHDLTYHPDDDFRIYPGGLIIDDDQYFITTPLDDHYKLLEADDDIVDFQDPSFLWNF